jgi:hypothetical protein
MVAKLLHSPSRPQPFVALAGTLCAAAILLLLTTALSTSLAEEI